MASEVQRGQLGVWGGVTSYKNGHLGEPAVYVTKLLPSHPGEFPAKTLQQKKIS